LRPDGTSEAFFVCGKATTNCVFAGEMLWVTNAGVLATGTDPSYGGTLCRVHIPGGGAPTHLGRVVVGTVS
jgi:gluconolactonase